MKSMVRVTLALAVLTIVAFPCFAPNKRAHDHIVETPLGDVHIRVVVTFEEDYTIYAYKVTNLSFTVEREEPEKPHGICSFAIPVAPELTALVRDPIIPEGWTWRPPLDESPPGSEEGVFDPGPWDYGIFSPGPWDVSGEGVFDPGPWGIRPEAWNYGIFSPGPWNISPEGIFDPGPWGILPGESAVFGFSLPSPAGITPAVGFLSCCRPSGSDENPLPPASFKFRTLGAGPAVPSGEQSYVPPDVAPQRACPELVVEIGRASCSCRGSTASNFNCELEVLATVKNVGTQPAGGFLCALDSPVGNDQVQISSLLDAGEARSLTFSVSFPAGGVPCPITFVVMVDSSQVIAECDETNNRQLGSACCEGKVISRPVPKRTPEETPKETPEEKREREKPRG